MEQFLSELLDLNTYKQGQNVLVTYEVKDRKFIASSVTLSDAEDLSDPQAAQDYDEKMEEQDNVPAIDNDREPGQGVDDPFR
jgi:hypothetical protein